MNRTKRLVRTVATTVAAGSLCMVMASAALIGTGTVNTSSLRLRASANTSSAILGTASRNETVLVLKNVDNNWYQVSRNGTIGYMSGAYLTVSASATGSFGAGKVTAGGSSLRMRSGPGTSHSPICNIPSGATVSLTGVSNGWYQVTYNGQSGYASGDYITPFSGAAAAQPAPAPSPAPAISENPSSGYGKITTSGASLRMRTGAGTGYSTICGIPNGAIVSLSGQTNGWYKVTYNGKTGYSSGTYITPVSGTQPAPAPSPSPAANETSGYGKIKTGGASLRMRTGAGTGYSTICGIPNGAIVTLSGQTNGWYKVTYNGKTGYSSGQYITPVSAEEATTKSVVPSPTPSATLSSEPSPSPSAAPVDTAKASAIVACAKQYLGVQYVYGGASPSGFDCSGFAQYVMQQCGYSIHRTASTQFLHDGTDVSKENLQPGDLVFFRTRGSAYAATHVGIYIGDSQFIHASSTGSTVRTNSIDSSWYSGIFVGGRRIAV